MANPLASFDNVDFSARWEDLRFPAQGIRIGSLTEPPDVDVDTGLLLFDGGLTNGSFTGRGHGHV